MSEKFLIALATLFSVFAILGRAQEQKAKDNAPQPLDCTSPKGADEKAVKAAQAAWAKHLDRNVEEEIDLGGGVKMIVVLIPPGISVNAVVLAKSRVLRQLRREMDGLLS